MSGPPNEWPRLTRATTRASTRASSFLLSQPSILHVARRYLVLRPRGARIFVQRRRLDRHLACRSYRTGRRTGLREGDPFRATPYPELDAVRRNIRHIVVPVQDTRQD